MKNHPSDTISTHFRWECSGKTDIGKLRKINQDAFLTRSEAGMWLVADGMGGHSAGELASQTIVDTLNNANLPEPLNLKVDFLEDNLKAINRHLVMEARRRGPNTVIGTTVVILLAYQASCILLWAGRQPGVIVSVMASFYNLPETIVRLKKWSDAACFSGKTPKTILYRISSHGR